MVSSAASEEVEALSAASGNACRHGKVGLLRHFAPQCFVPCEASCPAVGLAVDAYFKSGQGAAEDSVCHNKAAWRCFVEPGHVGACTPLITKAAAFGYSMPKSVGELDALCGRAHSSAVFCALRGLLSGCGLCCRCLFQEWPGRCGEQR